MSTGPGSADKAALRRAMLSRRAALPADERALTEQACVDLLLPRISGPVAAYLSVGTEPGTTALLAALAARSVEVLLPVVLPDGDLDWARAGDGVEPGPHGLLEPTGERLGREAIARCEVVVVPALAVDREGVRLGRGGGSYDRALPRSPGWVVALLHDGESVVELPSEPHDVRVHATVSPGRGLVHLRPHPCGPDDASDQGEDS